MTTREALDTAVARYGSVPRSELPRWLRQPQTEDELNLSIAVYVAGSGKLASGEVGPEYDENGVLTGWRGMRMTKPYPHL